MAFYLATFSAVFPKCLRKFLEGQKKGEEEARVPAFEQMDHAWAVFFYQNLIFEISVKLRFENAISSKGNPDFGLLYTVTVQPVRTTTRIRRPPVLEDHRNQDQGMLFPVN